MNAYELADDIQDAWCEGEQLTDVANMLRQQADKIAELQNKQVQLVDDLFAERKETIKLEDRIAELKKQLSLCKQSEKEGWRYADELEYHRKELSAFKLSDEDKALAKRFNEQRITPQTEPLSDEEIICSAEQAGFDWSDEKGIFVAHSNGSWIGLDMKIFDFTRAIEAKVRGEK